MSAMPDYSAFAIYAEGSDADFRRLDLDAARKAVEVLFAPGERHEIRVAPAWSSSVVNSADLDAAVETLRAAEFPGSVFYYSLNPLKGGESKATNKGVLRRRWILVDVDPVRPPDVCSTDAEKAEAGKVVDAVLDELSRLGWPAGVVVDSGNGWHILYSVDLPNNALSTQVVKDCLIAIESSCGTEAAKVDVSVSNAGRIAKLPGTWARKGPDTADRPHRQAKFIYVPDEIRPVPIGLLKELGKTKDEPPAPAAKKQAARDPWTLTAGFDSLRSYVDHAIARECAAVAMTPPGGRDVQLNTSIFNIATMSSWPELDEGRAKDALRSAALACGLPGRVVDEKLARAWADGTSADPRKRPEQRADVPALAKLPEGTTLTICASDVDPVPVDWLWDDRIAMGFIALFAGRTGVGKSFVLCDLAARLSTGREFPDGSPARPIGGTLFISEDPYQYVLVPRLKELGADLSRIRFMKWEAMANYSLHDTDYLNRAWEEAGKPTLIVVDPPANFLGAANEHKNSEIRGVLMRIVSWLESRAVAMVFITHYNKGGGDKALDALDRIMGSVAWSSSSRVACGFMIDPGDQSKCVFGGIKNNLGQKAEPLSYRIVKTETLAVVEWLGKSDTTLDDALNQKAPRKVSAVEFLIRQFRAQRCWMSNELYQLAKVEGVSRNALFEAKDALPIRATLVHPQDGGSKFWEWQAHPGWPPEEPAAERPQPLGPLGPLGRKSNGDNTDLRVSMSEECKEGETLSKSPKGAKRPKGTKGGEEQRAVKLLAGMLFAGPVERDRAVVVAAEEGVSLESLNRAAEHFGVDVEIRDGKEIWSLT